MTLRDSVYDLLISSVAIYFWFTRKKTWLEIKCTMTNESVAFLFERLAYGRQRLRCVGKSYYEGRQGKSIEMFQGIVAITQHRPDCWAGALL